MKEGKDEPSDDATWHLGKTELEIKVSEFEFLLWRLVYSFFKWQEDCQGCISNDDLSADEITLVHLVGMRDKPKTIYEMTRLINRDDMHNIQYSIKKLLKIGLLRKSKKAVKKAIAYELTEKGTKFAEAYGDMRRSLLIKLCENKEINWENAYKILLDFKTTYDEAGRLATLEKLHTNV